ncbi:MAG: YcgL domain-containing protein [Gammaproteobacteria bacterium]
MLCYIYRSKRKIDAYLYLVDKDDFSILPEDLLKIFGDPEFSFSFELSKDKNLAM